MNVLERGHNNEARTVETFDMTDFGFEEYRPARGGVRRNSNKDYLLFALNETAHNGKQLVLSFCEDTYKFVTDICGDTVNVGINDKGWLCIQNGTRNRVYGKTKQSRRGNISLGGLKERILKQYGDFRHLYVEVTPYGNFNAVIIKPTGERD